MNIRQRLSLDGRWKFWLDTEGALTPTRLSFETSREVLVPAPWQAQLPALRAHTGPVWYRQEVQLPADWLTDRLVLGFGAVDYRAEVWFNNRPVGVHEGGYLPFELDVTEVAHPGPNWVAVRVTDPPELFSEIPHGKQSWYGPLSGLWQSVWLEKRAPRHIATLRITPDLRRGRLEIHGTLSAPAEAGCRVQLNVIDPQGVLVADAETEIPAGTNAWYTTIAVNDPLPWSPDTPYLYHLHGCILYEGRPHDEQIAAFGFRTIEAREGKLWLNGQPLYLRAALDQDYYPETIATPPSLEFLEDQIRKAKAMGLNCLRTHIKVAAPQYYEVADRLGMLIWTELPNAITWTAAAAGRAREALSGIVERDWNHPSIIIWTIINEGWGVDLLNDAGHRAWLRETYHWLKALDPTRLVVDNSPCSPNFHVETDLDDFHFYRAIPDHRDEWDAFVDEFATRPDWTFSPHGDIRRTREEPLIVSEFGNWGLPDTDALTHNGTTTPWWFETGLEWGEGVVYPHGVRDRFQQWHLDRVFGSWHNFITETQEQEHRALRYEIESMRRRPEISGYVITELTDVHWECNGLLDMDRNPKAFFPVLAEVNADTVLIPRWERTACWSTAPVSLEVQLAHGAGPALRNAVLHWKVTPGNAQGAIAVPEIAAGQVRSLGNLSFPAPAVDSPQMGRLILQLQDGNGALLAGNQLEMAWLPRRTAPSASAPRCWTPELHIADYLADLGYPLADRAADAEVILTTSVDPTILDQVRRGARLLALVEYPEAFRDGAFGLQLLARAKTQWSGDWVSSFAWLRRSGPFAALPGGPMLDFLFDRIIPRSVLTGFGPWDFVMHVPAGISVGWVHKVAALVGRRQYGAGRAVLSTFRLLRDQPGADPIATTLLDALLSWTRQDLESEGC